MRCCKKKRVCERESVADNNSRYRRPPHHVYSFEHGVYIPCCGLTGYWRLVVIARVHAATMERVRNSPSLRKRACVHA